MKKFNMNKKDNSQDDMKKILVAKLFECVNGISNIQDEKGIPEHGLTSFVGEVGFGGKKFAMTIALTPQKIFDEFKKRESIL